MSLKPQLERKDNEEMQIETKHRRISPGFRASILARKKQVTDTTRSQRTSKEAFSSGCSIGSSILNETFNSIIHSSSERVRMFREHNLKLEDSVKYLFNSAKNYCQLLNKDFKTTLTGNHYTDIFRIYQELDASIPSTHELNIDACEGDGGHLFFTVYATSKFPDQFVFLPLKFIDHMSSTMAGIFKEFVALFSQSQYINVPGDNEDYDYIVECWLPEELYNDELDEQCKDLAKEYTDGRIPELFREINNIEVDSKRLLEKCMTPNKSLNNKDKELLSVIVSGISLMENNSLGRFDYSEDRDSLGEFEYDGRAMVEFDRTLAVLWDDDDFIGQNLQEFINCDIGEFGCSGPTQYIILSPETKETLSVSEYPMQFHKWFCELYEKLEAYEQHN